MSLKSKRVVAAMLDYYFCVMLVVIISGIIGAVARDVFNLNIKEMASIITTAVYFVGVLAFYFLKDLLFKNASLGKRIMKLEIVKKDGTQFTFVDCVKRMLPVALCVIEIYLLFSNDERLGDSWAKTAVVEKSNR